MAQGKGNMMLGIRVLARIVMGKEEGLTVLRWRGWHSTTLGLTGCQI